MNGRSKRVMHWLRFLLPIAAIGLAAVVLRNELPRPAAMLDALDSASPIWLGVAVLAELISMDMFARQQRRLLSAFGIRMSQARAVALTYSRSAITYAVPAGSAVSAGFAFSQFRARGASRSAATTVTVLSGLASTVGLLAVYAADVLGTFAPAALRDWLPRGTTHSGTGLIAETAGLIALVSAGVMLGVAVHHHHAQPKMPATSLESQPAPAREGATSMTLRQRVWDAVREVRAVPRKYWYGAVALAALNWLADMICLAAMAHALDLPLGLFTLGSAYLAVQLVRQVPLTPGGAGLVETGLLTALVSAGAGQAPAAAAVLGYRLLSAWLIIPVGLATWFALRRPATPSAPVTPAPEPDLQPQRELVAACR
jgi:uncharacterized membrane protein YbhN (UPF0104 family)